MSDTSLVTTIVVAAITSGATNVLAAPLEGVADHVRERVKTRLDRTLDSARAKAGDKPLASNDRIVAKVLNEAAWSDEEVVADYLGGVLAASSTDDDSGAAIVAQIGRLSARHLLLHYVIYRELRRLCLGDHSLNLYQRSSARAAELELPGNDLASVLGPDALHQLVSMVPVLVRESLVAPEWTYGPRKKGDNPPDWVLRVVPTGVGAELFLWGHGWPASATLLFLEEGGFIFLTDVPSTPGVKLTTPPEPARKGRRQPSKRRRTVQGS